MQVRNLYYFILYLITLIAIILTFKFCNNNQTKTQIEYIVDTIVIRKIDTLIIERNFYFNTKEFIKAEKCSSLVYYNEKIIHDTFTIEKKETLTLSHSLLIDHEKNNFFNNIKLGFSISNERNFIISTFYCKNIFCLFKFHYVQMKLRYLV